MVVRWSGPLQLEMRDLRKPHLQNRAGKRNDVAPASLHQAHVHQQSLCCEEFLQAFYGALYAYSYLSKCLLFHTLLYNPFFGIL